MSPRRVRTSPPLWVLLLAAVGAFIAVVIGAGVATYMVDRSLTPVPVRPAATAKPSPTPAPTATPTPTLAPAPPISPPPLPFTGEPIANPEPLTHGPQP